MLNYTVTSQTAQSLAGAQVDLTTPQVVLIITADPGYTVAAVDFSIGDALPTEITSVVFADVGDGTVSATVDFDPSFIMPVGDISLPIDIDGLARSIDYNTSGTLIISGTNLNPDSTSNPYSVDSIPGERETILFYIYADAGYYFETPPDLSFSSSQNPGDYSIFSAVPTTDIDGNIINYFYNIRYIRSHAGDVTGDEIQVLGNAVEIFVPNTNYFSYSIPRGFGSLTFAGTYATSPGDKQLLLVVYGDVGATVTIDISKNGAAATNVVTALPITFEGGYVKIPVLMTGAVASDFYDITLSGDIDPSFVQPNPLRINIQANIFYQISVAPIAGYTITSTGVTSVTSPQGYVLDGNKVNTSINAVFKVTKDDGANIALQLFPTWATDVTNLDYSLNGGTEIVYSKGINVTGNGTPELFITVSADVLEFGSTGVSSVITLTTNLNANPVTTDTSASVGVNDSVSISIAGNVSDADGDTLTPSVVTQPINGTVAVDGLGFIYTHTADNSFPDSFTYQVTDGYGVSNISTISVTVAGTNPSGLTPSGVAGLYRLYTDMGATASTINVTFDAGVNPGRIQLLYDNIVVADSLFVGDNLTDANRTATIADIETTQYLYQFAWVYPALGNGDSYGATFDWNVTKPIVEVTYAASTIAPTGNVRTTQANWGGQVGILNDNLDSADGNLVLSYTKPVGGTESIMVYVYGIAGSDWDITSITVT